MIAFTIVLIVLGILLLQTVGVDAEYSDSGVRASGKIGPFKIRFDKAFGGKKQEAKTDEKPAAEKPEKKLSLNRLLEHKVLVMDFLRAALHTLRRLRRRLCIDFIGIHYTAASRDPYYTAIEFGAANALMAAVTAAVYSGFKVRDSDFKTWLDYSISSPVLYVHVTMSLSMWELFYVGGGLVVELLNSLYRNR